jgi:hypothetical protein
MANSTVAGYAGGGYADSTGANFTTVDKFAFPSDTNSTLGTGLTAGNRDLMGMANEG